MTDYGQMVDHLLHIHGGLLSLRDSIPYSTPDPQAVMLRCQLTVAADKISDMVVEAARLRTLQPVPKPIDWEKVADEAWF